jgi:hypothetical protein
VTEAAFVENENTFGTATIMLAVFGTTVVRPFQHLERLSSRLLNGIPWSSRWL